MSKKITALASLGACVLAAVGTLSASDGLKAVFRSEGVAGEKAQETSGMVRLNRTSSFNSVAQGTRLDPFRNNTEQRRNAMKRIVGNPNLADATLLYGFVNNDGTWQTLSPLPGGVYSFHAAEGRDFMVREDGRETMEKPLAACYGNGKFYMLYSLNNSSMFTSRLDIYNASTWELEKSIQLSENDPDWNYFFRQCAAVNPKDGMIYAYTWGSDNTGASKPLVKIDPATGKMTVIENSAKNKFFQGLAFDDKGVLYGYTYNERKLYAIDCETGELTEKGTMNLGFTLSADPQAMCYEPATGKLLYAAVNGNNKTTTLFRVNPEDASCEVVSKLENSEHFLGLFIPEAPAVAPASPTGIRFEDNAVCFTAPSTTYTSGESLGTGELTVYITEAGGFSKEAKYTPGAEVSVPVTLAEGQHFLKVCVGNEAGRGPAHRLDTYVGKDVPTAVTDLTLEIPDGKKVTLTWNAPQTSVNGAAIDDNDVNYTIVRYPDETVVAEGFKETKFTEAVPEAHADYYYEVTAFNGDKAGETAVSNKVVAGEYWTLPYKETFDSQAAFDSFKVIDANYDLHTWEYMPSGFAYLQGNGTANVDTGIYDGNGNDDYLITPLIRLKAGRDYRLSFETYDHFLVYESMTILLGKSRDYTGKETEIFSTDKLKGYTVYTIMFHVDKDGEYALFFHGDAPGPSVNISMDNISLDEYGVYTGPAHVENLTATAGDLGEMNNLIAFDAPKATYKEGTLSTLTSIEIYRNGSKKPCKVFENPVPGNHYFWLDEDMPAGMNDYRVLAFNSDGQGEEALVSNWVGLDQPSDVTDFKLVMDADKHAVATFSPSTGRGKHGGYVNNDDVTYALYRYNERNFTNHWEKATEFSKELKHVDTGKNIYAGQQYVDYMLVASNAAGTSDGVINGIVLGTPYELPYEESFPGAKTNKDPWTLYNGSYKLPWAIKDGSGLPVKPYDGDGGMMVFSILDEFSYSAVISGPRVDLSSEGTHELSFYMWHGFEAEPEDLELVEFLNYDDEGWDEAALVPYNNGTTGWMRYSVPVKTAGNVQIAFGANAADASASIYIDALKIAEGVQKDVTVASVSVSDKRVEPGTTVNVTAFVSNYGMENATDVKVSLTDPDGNTVAEKTLATVAPNEVTPVVFEFPTDRTMASGLFIYTANVSTEGDANADNNEGATVSFFVKGSLLPAPEKLAALPVNGAVELSWEKPATDEVNDAVTDGFDDYESFIIDNIGDWKTYDGDGTNTAYFNGPQVPNAFDPKAWQVWAPEEAGFSLEKFDVLVPKSGDKYLACWAASDGKTSTLPNDDWLISPEIVGGSDVSFWYRMPNTGSDPQKFEMLYSTTDQEPESFTVFDSDAITFGTDWVYFEYTLPADARYFAIRSCSEGIYTVAFLDDLTYTPLYGATTKLTLEGYNVYRDNQLIKTVKETSYKDVLDNFDKHVYNVTAVYAASESNYSNAAEGAAVNSVDGVNDGRLIVKGLRGLIAVAGAEGRSIEIMTVAGQKVAVSADGSCDSFAVEAGIYIVKVGDRSFKIRVR